MLLCIFGCDARDKGRYCVKRSDLFSDAVTSHLAKRYNNALTDAVRAHLQQQRDQPSEKTRQHRRADQ